jgi:hypothetical protein
MQHQTNAIKNFTELAPPSAFRKLTFAKIAAKIITHPVYVHMSPSGQSLAGLPDDLFSNQNSQLGQIFEDLIWAISKAYICQNRN